MNAKELADKFAAKVAAAVTEKEKQTAVAAENQKKRSDDVEHCKRAMADNVLPFLSELKSHLTEGQFSFAPQIDIHDHNPVGVSFTIGNGPVTTILIAFGNVIVTR